MVPLLSPYPSYLPVAGSPSMQGTVLVLLSLLGTVSALRLAIVGAGPVGLFLAAKLLANDSCPVTEVDIFEALDDPRVGRSDRSYAIGLGRRSFTSFGTIPGLAEYITQHATQAIKHTERISGWRDKKEVPNVNNATHTWISNQVSSHR